MSTTKLRNNQSGLVSIIVSIGFIALIALISTSFALLSRRESRQALDRQLSTQAFYAAESGINDAIKSGASNIPDCDGVNNTTNFPGGPNLGNGLSYTCVLVDDAPTSLELGPVSDSKVVRVQASSNIARIRISWQDFNGKDTDDFGPAGFLLPQQSYDATNPDSYPNKTGILRTTIIPVTANLNRTDLINNSQTLFLYPLGVGSPSQPGSFTYTTGQATQGQFVDGQCNKGNTASSPGLPQYCNVDIKGLTANAATTTNVFYVRLKGIYQSSKVTIQAYADDNPATPPMELSNGQIVIDATGKATDVLRRIRVRVPFNSDFLTPDFALETADSICKKISVTPTTVTDGCEPYN